MIFKEFGNKDKPVIIFIHSEFLSYWMWANQIEDLQKNYRIIATILDGHSDNASNSFESIQKSANQIIAYIDKFFNGHVFAICGVGIGAQITIQILAKRNDISTKAVIEAALVIPNNIITSYLSKTINIKHNSFKKKLYAINSAKKLYIKKSWINTYQKDLKRISKQTHLNILSSKYLFSIPTNYSSSSADILILCPKHENHNIKNSAKLLYTENKNSILYFASGCRQNIGLKKRDLYLQLLKELFETTHKNYMSPKQKAKQERLKPKEKNKIFNNKYLTKKEKQITKK
ncbi:MAG: alpha/beta hydrolase [Clostridia bacterium]